MTDGTLTAVLAEIRARCDAASTGPWETTERHGRGYDDEGWSELAVKSPGGVIAMTYQTDALETENPEADGAFIAHAREDVPRLLAALEAVLGFPRSCDEYKAISRALTGEGEDA